MEAPLPGDPSARASYAAAAVDTYCVVWYTFESNSWQGWTRFDNTAQRQACFHVDDFAGLGGGDFGKLHAIEGTKSLWCGLRPSATNQYTCSWKKAPGYGNGWLQLFGNEFGFPFTSFVRLSFHGVFDTEPGHDTLKVQIGIGGWSDFCACPLRWKDLAVFSGRVDTVVTDTTYLAQSHTSIRFVFASDGEGSDEDGLWNSDGAAIIDSISISDANGLIAFEDFENWAVGDTANYTTNVWWKASRQPPFGEYSGMVNNLSDKDPCGSDFGSQIVFFIGSTEPSSSYPGLHNTTSCSNHFDTYDMFYPHAPCQNELVISPIIDLRRYSTGCSYGQDGTIPPGDLSRIDRTLFRYQVYGDPSASSLLFDTWYVRSIKNRCPGFWCGRNSLTQPTSRGFETVTVDLTDLISSDSIQVAIGVVDLCTAWSHGAGSCGSHNPTPWYDDARVYRTTSPGPEWSYRDCDLFQDNFPSDEWNIESYVRADAALDVNPPENPAIRPGDSVVVSCHSILGGVAHDADGGPAVYMHARCTYAGCNDEPSKAPYIDGVQLQGTYGAWKSVDANHWNIIRCDSARQQGAASPSAYCCDLNDSLFTRGYVIEYYFTANDNNGEETALPHWARSYGPYFEFTCLPTKCSDALFVNDYRGIGSFRGLAEDYWDQVFKAVPVPPQPDRYDVNSPGSGVGNGPGSRAKNPQLIGLNQGNWLGYASVIWDSGDLTGFTITDGVNDKSNDAQMLIDWMSLFPFRVALWVCGDNVAYDLKTLGHASGLALLQQWCGVDVACDSYFDETGGLAGGGVVNPLITGALAPEMNLYQDGDRAYKWYAFGGCPALKRFDVLQTTGTGQVAATYPAYNSQEQIAAIGNQRVNSHQDTVRTMWFGFSYMTIRDDTRQVPQDRFLIAAKTFAWSENFLDKSDVSQSQVPAAYRLAQNYPNPFNPSTTIKYDMKEKGPVTIKVYNVAGELVRTLVDGIKPAGSYSVTWDGKNNLGAAVGSGIYFYKMDTKSFSERKKMVLLR